MFQVPQHQAKGENHTKVSKVLTSITQVEVEILQFKNTCVEVKVSTLAFYLSKSVKVLVTYLLSK